VNIDHKVPPMDLDAEAAVLSAVMLSNGRDVVDEVIGILRPQDFFSESHRRIFEAVVALHEKNDPCDMVTVGGSLKISERLAQVGGMSYLAEILDAAPAPTRAPVYAKTVKRHARMREFIAQTQRAIAEAYCGAGLELIDEHAAAMANLADGQNRDTLQHVKGALKDAFEEALRASKTTGGITGERTGIDRLDRVLTGLHDGDLTILAARPGMGKTALACTALVTVAHNGGGGLLFSLEMPRKSIAMRVAASEARVAMSAVRGGNLGPKSFESFLGSVTTVGGLPFWLDDEAGQTVQMMRAKARRVQRELVKIGKQLRLVVVDYIQLASGPGDNREQEVSAISRALKSLAKELSCPVIALSQLNRAVETRTNKRPMLADLRESGAIEQDADNIIFIYRDDYYTKDKSDEPGIAELLIGKQRNGPTGVVKCRFDASCIRFDNLTDGEFEDGGDS
jgi:replicative DNA helicase